MLSDPPTAPVPVSDRVLAVLDLFMGPSPEWTVEDAATAMAIPASTIYRYFRSLMAHGLIHDHRPGRYVLGAGVMALDRQMRLHDPLIEIVAPAMQRIVGPMEQPCVVLLARLYKDNVMCVSQVRHREPAFSISYERGRMMPLDRGATSKVILAHLPVSVMRRLARSQPQLLARDAAIRREMRRIRADGFCVATGEVDAGRIGIAVPIILPHRKQVASLSVVLEREPGDVDGIVTRLRAERHAIEMALSSDGGEHNET